MLNVQSTNEPPRKRQKVLSQKQRADLKHAALRGSMAQQLDKKVDRKSSTQPHSSPARSISSAPSDRSAQFPAPTDIPPIVTDGAIHPNTAIEPFPSRIGPLFPGSLSKVISRYTVHALSIQSSSKIHQRVQALRTHLVTSDLDNVAAEPSLVVLYAREAAACKLISVLEIAKRELDAAGVHWYQYTRIAGLLVPKVAARTKKGRRAQLNASVQDRARSKSSSTGFQDARKKANPRLGIGDSGLSAQHQMTMTPDQEKDDNNEEDDNDDDDDDDDDEDAFETMTTKQTPESELPTHAVPTLSVYISRVSVPELRDMFGEQSSTPPEKPAA